MTIEEALAHVGSAYNSEYVKRRALEALPHYIWTQGTAKKRRGFCTACGQWSEELRELPEWVVDDPYAEDYSNEFEGPNGLLQALDTSEYNEKVTGKSNHLDYGWCPICGARGQFRSLNMGRKHMHDHIFLIMYSKSETEDGAITCVGYDADVYWDKMNDRLSMETPIEIKPDEVCVFRDGKGGQRFIKELRKEENGKFEWRFIKKRECKSGYMPGAGYFGIMRSYSRKMILDVAAFQEAVEGTRVGKLLPGVMAADKAAWFDKIGLLDRMMRYPCIEYIIRLGFRNLAIETIDQKCGHILNYRGKTAKAVFRLTDEQWSEVKGKKLDIRINTLILKDYFAKRGMRADMELCAWLDDEGQECYVDDMMKTADEIKQDGLKLLKYCKRKSVRLHDFLDYLRQLEQLRMSIDGNTLFPKDFDEMHDRMTKRIEYKRNEKYDINIQKRLDELGEYAYSGSGLVLRPMQSSAEIVDEGTALCHCVGGYVARYADGNTILCALRDEAEPEKPMYTVEFAKTGTLIQCRGYQNRTDKKDKERLEAFWKLFEQTRADRKRQIEREKKAIEKERKTA